MTAESTLNDETSPKQYLLDVATRLFAEHGFGQTSVREIVAAANVSKGALYHYFESKDDMLVGIYEPLLEMQKERLDAIVASDFPPAEQLVAAAQDVVVTSLQNLAAMAVFFQSAHLLGPDRRAQVRLERRRYHEQFRGIVERGQAAGTFRTDLSADLVTHMLFGSVHHLFTWYHPGGTLSPEEVAQSIGAYALSGLTPPAPRAG